MSKVIDIFSTVLSRKSGGIENTAYYFAYEFSKNYHTEVYCLSGGNEEIEHDNLEMHLPKCNNKVRNLIAVFFMYLQKTKHSDYSHIAICMTWKHAIVPCFLSKRCKYIVLTHGCEMLPTNHSFVGFVENVLRNIVLRKATYICSNSRFTSALVKDAIPSKQAIVIHPLSGEELHQYTQGEEYSVFSLGRIEERKGFQDVLRAISLLREKIPNIHYYVAGSGPYLDELKRIAASEKIEDYCSFLGKIDEDMKHTLFDRTEVFVMPSFYNEKEKSIEGFGIVYLEANAHGKPAIGTYSGGIPDAIIDGETGILVEERDVFSLAEAIEKILCGEVTISPSICQQWAEKHYYTEIVNKYIELINSIEEGK